MLNKSMAKLSSQEKDKIVDLYQSGVLSSKLAVDFSIHISTVTNILKSRGIQARSVGVSRKYYLDETKFNTIDTPEDAYWLGFLLADGYICRKTLGFDLMDEEPIIRFKSYLNSQHPVVSRPHPVNGKTIYQFRISSKQLVYNLSRFGVVPRKSKIICWPKTAKELDWHLIRGYFDGDGSISSSKQGNYRRRMISICGTTLFLDHIRTVLATHNINSGIRPMRSVFSMHVTGNRQVDRCLELMYDNSNNIRLTRKFEKWVSLRE